MTPEELQQVAQLRAMALRGQQPQAMTRDADVLSAIGGAMAGWGGKTGAEVSQAGIQRGDALRQLANQQTMATQREAGDSARSIADLASRRDIAASNNAAEMERLKLQLGAQKDKDAAEKAGAVAKTEEGLRKELGGMQVAKDAIAMQSAYGGIQKALGQGTAAGDMAGIFQFMKVLDPTSSVREGEYANAKNTTGVPEQLLNMYNKAIDGKLLDGRQRQDFLNTAKGKYTSQLGTLKKYADFYGGLAKEQGADPARVIGGYDFSSLEDQPQSADVAQPKSKAEYAQLPSGAVYVDTDGQTKRKK